MIGEKTRSFEIDIHHLQTENYCCSRKIEEYIYMNQINKQLEQFSSAQFCEDVGVEVYCANSYPLSIVYELLPEDFLEKMVSESNILAKQILKTDTFDAVT